MSKSFIQPLGMAHNPRAAALLVDRTFNESPVGQYRRELVVNSLQAEATEIGVTGIRLQDWDGEESGIKAAFVDNGFGMSDTKITDYIGELFNGESVLGEDGNFQMGARVSTLPFNREGVLVASWTQDDPDGTLIQIAWDDASETYGVVPQQNEEGEWTETGAPQDFLKHPVIEEAGQGTVVVLLGSSWGDHTVGAVRRDAHTGGFVFPSVRKTHEDWHYYNSKFWRLPDGVRLHVMWGPRDLSEWPRMVPKGEFVSSSLERLGFRTQQGVAERIASQAEEHGSVQVRSARGYRATVHWALFAESKFKRGTESGGSGSDTRDYGIPLPLFGELHNDELYNMRRDNEARTVLDYYGVSRTELRERVVLVVEPAPRGSKFIGARPSGARDRLLIANAGLPHDEWGAAFAEQMPKAIADRLAALNGENSQDQADRQRRIRDRLRSVFSRPSKFSKEGEPSEEADTPQSDPRSPGKQRPGTGGSNGSGGSTGRRSGRGPQFGRKGSRKAQERRARHQLPITPVWDASEFAESPGLIAHWVEATRDLYLNPDHGVVRQVVAEQQSGRRSDKREDIDRITQETIADHLIGLIVSAEMYVGSSLTGGQVFGRKLVEQVTSDENLTAACLNVITLEHLVALRFKGRTGFRRGAVAPNQEETEPVEVLA